MRKETDHLSLRWLYLVLCTVALSFAGVIYAWSILKAPLAEAFGWQDTALALNFTLTMCAFCLGGFLGSRVSRAVGVNVSVMGAGLLAGGGFALASLMNGSIILLYITYAGMAGLGIGIAYNVIISTVSAWFPDKRGFCSGCLLMGFGLTSLAYGSLIDGLMANESIGWRGTFLLFGGVMAALLVITGLLLRKPSSGVVFPATCGKKGKRCESFEGKDLSPAEMLARPSFWLTFIYMTCLIAVGNSVISFARDLAISTGATAALATTLVGVLSACNGVGRILTGALFDAAGRRFTMIAANLLTIVAAALTLVAVMCNSLLLCIVGLCLTGLSYGACPTVASAFTSAFYGQKHFATNYSILNFNLCVASFVATACAGLRASTGSFTAPFGLLLGLASVALILNLCVRRP
ncbi:MAG: MFS transporter [Clostridia bacterium]|nr:MFS transporter [Clostridia bacterium]